MKIYIAGHRGMVGGAILRQLEARQAAGEELTLITRSSSELDLTDQAQVRRFFQAEKPDQVILAAAKVGGIVANNSYPAQFIYENLMIASNVIHQAYEAGVQKLLQLGSSCIYPKAVPQPMREDALLTGPLELTNEPYAISKIAGIKLCESYNRQYGVDYRSVMPTNLYGPGDNYHPDNSHVLPALLRRIHEAKEAGAAEVQIWGTGTPRREFMFVDDLADALIHLLSLDNPPDWVNVGTGSDISILELAQQISSVVGYEGTITTDTSKPDGTPRKLTSIELLKSTGWQPKTDLLSGLQLTYQDFLAKYQAGTLRSK